MQTWLLILLFLAASALGYKILSDVPSLLHTPLMSGMNALSGVTILGALAATALASTTGNRFLGMLAIILASVNVIGGFAVTDRMLRMFKSRKGEAIEHKHI